MIKFDIFLRIFIFIFRKEDVFKSIDLLFLCFQISAIDIIHSFIAILLNYQKLVYY
jgi:hypothetical protein